MRRKMTDDEQRRAVENRGLVSYVIRNYFPGVLGSDEYPEYKQVGMLGLCRAAMTWVPKRGVFSTYACHCIKRAIWAMVRDSRAACRDKIKEAYSLDELMPDMKEPATYGEMLEAAENVESQIGLIIIRDSINRLSERDRTIVLMTMKGHSQREISKMVQLSQSKVSAHLRRIRQRILEEVGA